MYIHGNDGHRPAQNVTAAPATTATAAAAIVRIAAFAAAKADTHPHGQLGGDDDGRVALGQRFAVNGVGARNVEGRPMSRLASSTDRTGTVNNGLPLLGSLMVSRRFPSWRKLSTSITVTMATANWAIRVRSRTGEQPCAAPLHVYGHGRVPHKAAARPAHLHG